MKVKKQGVVKDISKARHKFPKWKYISIFFFVMSAFVIYGIIAYQSYLLVNSIEPQKASINEILSSTSSWFSPECFSIFSKADAFEIIISNICEIWYVFFFLFVFTYLIFSSAKPREFRGREYGSARWANETEKMMFIDEYGIPVADNFFITTTGTAVDVPKYKHFKKLFYTRYKQYKPHNYNEILFGGSGASKTFGKIKPDIMNMYGNYIVTDPKGELYADTAAFMKKHGYDVKVLNFENIAYSNAYNPFNYLYSEQSCLDLADLFMNNSRGEGEKADFWDNSAKELLTACIIYLFSEPFETKSFGRVLELVNSIGVDNNGNYDEKTEFSRCMISHTTQSKDYASRYYSGIKGLASETLSSITKTLSTRLQLWGTEITQAMTTKDEIDFASLCQADKKTIYYCILPPSRNTFKVLSAIFFSQLFEFLMRYAKINHHGKLPRQVSVLIDEFANIGKLPSFDTTLSVTRSFNIRVCIVLQNLPQLKSLYDKQWNGIIANCSMFEFIGGTDAETTEYISKKLGKTTIISSDRSYNRGNNSSGGSDSEKSIARELMLPDEVGRSTCRNEGSDGIGNCIIFIDEYYPFYLEKFKTVNHRYYNEVGSSSVGINLDMCSDLESDYKEHSEEMLLQFEEVTQRREKEVKDMIEQMKKDDEKRRQEEREKRRAEIHNADNMFFAKPDRNIENNNNAHEGNLPSTEKSVTDEIPFNDDINEDFDNDVVDEMIASQAAYEQDDEII